MNETKKPNNLKINVSEDISVEEYINGKVEFKEVIKRTADVLETTNEILLKSSKSQSRQQFLTTLIGSVLGFILAIFLFFITNYFQEEIKKNNLKNALFKECNYNILQIERTINQLTETKNKIIDYSESKFVFPILTKKINLKEIINPEIRSTFFNKAYDTGLLYEHVDYAEISRYDYYKKTSEQLIRDINAKIFKFNEDDQVAFRNNQEIKDEFNIVTETYKEFKADVQKFTKIWVPKNK